MQLRVKLEEAVQRRMARKINKVLLEIDNNDRAIIEMKQHDIKKN